MWSEALHVVTDPGHILAEAMFASVEALIGALVGVVLVRRHDRRKHPKRFPSFTFDDPAGFRGIPIIKDEHCPPDKAYLLDTRNLIVGPELKQALIKDITR